MPLDSPYSGPGSRYDPPPPISRGEGSEPQYALPPSRSSTSSNFSPLSSTHPTHEKEYHRPELSILDQLLPVPISDPDPAIRNRPWFLTDFRNDVRLISLRRVASLAVLFLFGVVVCWYAGMYAEVPGEVEMIGSGGVAVGVGPVERQREAMERFRAGMQRLSSFGAEVVIEQGEELSVGDSAQAPSPNEEEPPSEEDQLEAEVTSGSENEVSEAAAAPQATPVPTTKSKDWSRYTLLQTISPERVAPDLPDQRFVFIGDVHGSLAPLQRLLAKISYDAQRDTIIHVGDLIIKGPKPNQVVDFMREAGALGVRGNHDQKVIEWRGWMEWAGGSTQNEGESGAVNGETAGWRGYVDQLDRVNGGAGTDGVLASFDGTTADRSEELRVPSDWEWRSEHWTLARRMPDADYEYLLSLPLTLHLPAFHAIVVHAGLLARDPTMDPLSDNQLLPIEVMIGGTRTDVEKAILKAIPQNQVPYNLLEMRSVKKSGKVINSGKKGIPWSDIWNQEMTRCRSDGAWTAQQLVAVGYEQGEDETEANEDAVPEVEETTSDDSGTDMDDERRELEKRKTIKHVKLPRLPALDCSPVTVIYGHAASRGLDIQPFSKGLDSACVAGHQLTAMVLGDVSALWTLSDAGVVVVGQETGLLVSVDCKKGGK